MKQAIIGLRKRETYDELINDLNHDLITNYPDRRASELENSSYMSQLRGGFEEMLIQNDNLMKKKMKDIVLKEEARDATVGHHEIAIHADRWRPHVPPEPERFYTPERPAPAPESAAPRRFEAAEPLRVPAGQPVSYMPNRPEIQVSETRSRSSRKARDRNQPIINPVIQEAGPEQFQIGTPKSRSGRKGRKSNLAHDVDPDVEEAHAIAIDDEEMHQRRHDDLREQSIVMARMMLEAAQNTAIDDFMAPHGEKRREEGADPKPAKPKAKTTKPPDTSPEGQHEPKGKPGRPKNTPASSSTDVPSQPKASPAKPKAKAAPEASPEPKKSPGRPKKEATPKKEAVPEETKSKSKPVTKDIPHKKPIEQKGNTPLIFTDLQEYLDSIKGIGVIREQMALRKMPVMSPAAWKMLRRWQQNAI